MITDINFNDSKHRAWEKITNKVHKNGSGSKVNVINWRLIGGVAASIVLALTIGLLTNDILKKGNTKILYQAGTSSRKISLKDSSEITVLANSSVTIDEEFGIGNRKVKLNGSAYFSVIHDPSKPFVIDMNTLYIKDLGTVFNVVTSSTGDTILINVIEGRVSVYNDFGSSENVSAGEKAMYIKSQKVLRVFNIRQSKDIDTTINKRKHSTLPPADSSVKNYPYSSYPFQYPLKEGYSPEGKRALMYKDSVETARIVTDMSKDRLITDGQPLSFKLSNTEFIINGINQPDAVFQRYRKKYVPAVREGEEWVWSHNFPGSPGKLQ